MENGQHQSSGMLPKPYPTKIKSTHCQNSPSYETFVYPHLSSYYAEWSKMTEKCLICHLQFVLGYARLVIVLKPIWNFSEAKFYFSDTGFRAFRWCFRLKRHLTKSSLQRGFWLVKYDETFFLDFLYNCTSPFLKQDTIFCY